MRSEKIVLVGNLGRPPAASCDQLTAKKTAEAHERPAAKAPFEAYPVNAANDCRAQSAADLPISEWEAAFPGQQVHCGMPNHMRRAMHLARAFVRAAEHGDYVLAARLMWAVRRAVEKGRHQ